MLPDTIRAFFGLLNTASINYVLVKNINNELPYALAENKDIDILVDSKEIETVKKLILDNGFVKTIHPQSYETGWSFAYGTSECLMFKNNERLWVDIQCELCLKSLMGNILIPMDKYINEAVWSNKKWDENNGWWITDDKTRLVYLISRCVFDKNNFSQLYINEINGYACLLNDDDVQRMLGMVFFKFKNKLIEMIIKKQYNNIIDSYISFCDY